MSIPTSRDLEFLASLPTCWRRLYLSEIERLLHEDGNLRGDRAPVALTDRLHFLQRVHSESGRPTVEKSERTND
jgi:hypothetical protein